MLAEVILAEANSQQSMQLQVSAASHMEWSRVQAILLMLSLLPALVMGYLQDVCRCVPVAVSNGPECWPTSPE